MSHIWIRRIREKKRRIRGFWKKGGFAANPSTAQAPPLRASEMLLLPWAFGLLVDRMHQAFDPEVKYLPASNNTATIGQTKVYVALLIAAIARVVLFLPGLPASVIVLLYAIYRELLSLLIIFVSCTDDRLEVSRHAAAAALAAAAVWSRCDERAVRACHGQYIACFTWAMLLVTGSGGTDEFPSATNDLENLIVTAVLGGVASAQAVI